MNAQLHCHRHHLETLFIAFCVEGQKFAHFIKALDRWDMPRVWWNEIIEKLHTCDRRA